MKLPANLGLKIYLIIFGIFCFSDLMALSLPEGGTYIYYNTLLTFYHPAGIWYVFAILNALLSCLCLFALFRRAFSLTPVWKELFQWLFFARIATAILGHNYEFLALKSAFIGTPVIGYISIGVWFLFTYPSFKEHYCYAFKH